MGRATITFSVGPAPLGPGEGSKCQISFNFNYKVNFKDVLFQTLRVYSQMKDIKHTRRDFYSVAWVMLPKSNSVLLSVLYAISS